MWGDVNREYGFMQQYEDCEICHTTAHFKRHRICCFTWTKLNNNFIPYLKYGRTPMTMTCPNCLTPTQTRITWVVSRRTHKASHNLSAVLCCFLPYCTKRWKIAKHNCKYCEAFIGLGT